MENQNERPTRVYNFNHPVGQFIEHVDTVNFSLDGDGKFHFSNVGQVNGTPKNEVIMPAPPQEKKATKGMMSSAMLKTLNDGYWKSARSWAIVYAVYQIWGYTGRVNDFLNEVATWPDTWRNSYPCNRDAISKFNCKYHLSKDLQKWRGDGVPEQYCILGMRLDEELEKMRAQKSLTKSH